MNRKKFFLAAVPMAVLTVLAPAAAHPSTGGETARAGVQKTKTWAGWGAYGKTTKNFVESIWRVPGVTCTSERSRAAAWIGLYGKHGTDVWLPQVGTISACNQPGYPKTAYIAFFQMYHGSLFGGTDPVPVDTITLQPGDKVLADVYAHGPDADGRLQFEVTFTNMTGAARGDATTFFSTPLSTDPNVPQVNAQAAGGCLVENENDKNLAQFKTVTFATCRVDSVDGSTATLNTRYDMYDKSYTNKLADTGSPSSSGRFTVTWKRLN